MEDKLQEVLPLESEKTSTLSEFSKETLNQWNFKTQNLNYNRSHLYGDLSYRKDFMRKEEEVLARLGFVYYLGK